MKQKIYFVALLCATLFGFASCLSDSDDDDKDNKLLFSAYSLLLVLIQTTNSSRITI